MSRVSVVCAFLLSGCGLRAQMVPPLLADHLEPSSALGREHVFHARVSGRVTDGQGGAIGGARVFVYGNQPFYWGLPIGAAVTDQTGGYSLVVTGHGRTTLWVAAPADRPFATANVPITLCSGATSQAPPLVLEIPAGEAQPATTVRGRLRCRQGKPMSDVFVRLGHDRLDPTAFTQTDAEGRFAITTRLGLPNNLSVFFGRQRIEIEHAPGLALDDYVGWRWKADLLRELDVQSQRLRASSIAAEGAEGIKITTHCGGLLLPTPSQQVFSFADSFGASAGIASAPGHLPRSIDGGRAAHDFATDEPRRLRLVGSDGKPVASATVDLCVADDPRFEEHRLGTLQTDAQGVLEAGARANATYVVYAYADGYEPVRGLWTRDELTLVAPLRNAKLTLTVPATTRSVFVRRAGVFDLAAVAYPTNQTAEISLAPGDYEITCYAPQGPATAVEAVQVAAGEHRQIELAADHRPTVRVGVPKALAGAKAPWAFGSRQTWGGMISKILIHTTRGGPMPRRELVATVEPEDLAGGELHGFVLRFPTSGRYTITVGIGAVRYFREVDLQFGGSYRVDLPAKGGTLTGTLAKWSELWDGHAPHGVVGPRLCLEPVDATSFGILSSLPEAAEFTLAGVPPGKHRLHHHLYETGLLVSDKGTSVGRMLEVAAEQTTALGTLARAPAAKLEVTVLRADGQPVEGRLSVRDRMFEAWQHDLQQNTTLDDACDPIPTPPSARLVAGQATLPRIHAGVLQFVLDLDDGRRVFFTRDVEPGRRLAVQLAVMR